MTETLRIPESPLAQLVALLACPSCHGELEDLEGRLYCGACLRDFPIEDGVVLMADTAADAPDLSQRVSGTAMLERQLQQEHEAANSGRHIRRLRDELHMVTRILSSLPFSETLLDLGCRGGRFSGPMQPACRLLIEADRRVEA